MLNFTLRQIEYFRAVAVHKSISAAAETERVSRSALASAISDLETALGCQLFVRKKARGVVLTPMGAQLFQMSADVLESAGRIPAAMRGGALSGRLGIGCFTSLGPTVIPALFEYFCRKHPGVTLQLRTGHAEQLMAMMRAGEIELAIGYGMSHHPDVDSEDLYQDRMHVILPNGHRLADAQRVRAIDLVDETLVLLDAAPSPETVRSYFTSQGMVPRPRYRFQDYEVVRSLVARGVGYSLVIQRSVSAFSYEGRGVVELPLDPEPFATPVCCTWLRDRELTAAARAACVALRRLSTAASEAAPQLNAG